MAPTTAPIEECQSSEKEKMMYKVDQRLSILGTSMEANRKHERVVFGGLSAKCKYRFATDSCAKLDIADGPVKFSCNITGCPFIRKYRRGQKNALIARLLW